MAWVFAQRTSDTWWREQAEKYSQVLEGRKDDTGTHDLGFLFEPSWGRWFDLEGGEGPRHVLIDAGRTMASRFQPAGGYLRSWIDPGSTFIDIMMNVGIIFRAATYTGDEKLYDAAVRHCRTSRRHLMRGDGSTVHEGWFDVRTGEFLRASTHQGWRSDSAWARGQAWAIYGFTTAYNFTSDADFLDAACRAADFYIAQTPSNGIPPNDWMDPAPSSPWESSAAAIAAAGLLRLAGAAGELAAGELAAGEPGAAERYREYALRILRSLLSTEFIAVEAPGWEGILRHATYHTRNKLAIDESVMWGDYYLVEALDHAMRLGAQLDQLDGPV